MRKVVNDQKITIALAEWGYIQSIISRKADSKLKSMNWLYTLISAITVASYLGKIIILNCYFLLIILSIILLFSIKEIIIDAELLIIGSC